MNWVVISFLCATAEAAKDAASKFALRKSDPITVGLISFLFALPYFLWTAFSEPFPPLDATFLGAFAGQVSLFALSVYLYQRALASSEISLTVPLICFTPLFLLFVSPLILGEYFSASGIAGMVLIVAGAYALYLQGDESGILGPLKNLIREKGARLMLAVAFIWSITGCFDRLALLHSSRAFWPAVQLTSLVIIFFAARVALKKSAPLFTPINLLVGFFNGFSMFFYYWAATLQKIGYVISVKRCSVLMAVLIGHFVFHEANVRARLFGAALMLAGLVCISGAK